MLTLDKKIVDAFSQSHGVRYEVAAFYGADLTLPSVPITTDGSIAFNGDAQIQGSGSLYVARDGGESLVPKSKTDPLASYGQEVSINYVIPVGGVEHTVPMGRFRISDVPSAREYFRMFPSQALVVGWACELQLKDRFEQIIADDFLEATAPIPGNTTWAEIQRLSPIPVVRSLTDRPVPAGIVYNSRMGAIETLMTNLGGVPHMTRQGALTARKADAWLTETAPVFTINGVIDMSDGMSNELFNQVVVTSSIGDNNIVAIRRITDPSNPLAVSRMGGRTYKWSSPLITTQAAANTSAETILARVSSRQSRTITVTCLPRPDIEVGDYGVAIDTISGRQVFGEVKTMRFNLDPTADMAIELIVAETR